MPSMLKETIRKGFALLSAACVGLGRRWVDCLVASVLASVKTPSPFTVGASSSVFAHRLTLRPPLMSHWLVGGREPASGATVVGCRWTPASSPVHRVRIASRSAASCCKIVCTGKLDFCFLRSASACRQWTRRLLIHAWSYRSSREVEVRTMFSSMYMPQSKSLHC
jgi:hypothetical protein